MNFIFKNMEVVSKFIVLIMDVSFINVIKFKIEWYFKFIFIMIF